MATRQTNFRLSQEALDRLDQLAQQLGLSRTGVIEMILRHATFTAPRVVVRVDR